MARSAKRPLAIVVATTPAPPPLPSAPTPPPVVYKTRAEAVAEAAYLRAERRGFAPGHELEDWLAAEKEVDASLLPE